MADNLKTNEKFKNTVSTSMIQLFDNNHLQLRLSGHDTALNISLWIPSVDPVTGKYSYPATDRYTTLVRPDKVSTLDKMIKEEIIPAVEAGKKTNISLFVTNARDKIVEIGVDENADMYLTLHLEVDPMTVKPGKSYRFNFAKTVYGKNYDPATGDISIQTCEGNFYIFAAVVNDFVALASANVNAHGYRKGNEYSITAAFKYLKSIANKLGVTVPSSYTPSNYSGQSNAANNAAPNHVEDNVEVHDVSSMDDLPF